MSVSYKLVPIKELPKKKYMKRSRYDGILDDFIAMAEKEGVRVVEVKADQEPNYLRSQLKKRIERRELPVKASVINGRVYLEFVGVEA